MSRIKYVVIFLKKVVNKLAFRDLHRTWPVGSARMPLVDL